MNRETNHPPANGPTGERAEIRRAWELLGRATPAPVPHGFAAHVAAVATHTRQDARPSRWMATARLSLPLAAAAALLLSVASNLLLPDPVMPVGIVDVVPVENGDLTSLARIEAALLLLPDNADDPSLDAAAIELASVDDPTTLTDEQLFGFVY